MLFFECNAVFRQMHNAKSWQDFTFLDKLKGIGVGKEREVVVRFDGTNDEKVRRGRARRYMAMESPAKSAAIGNDGAGLFDFANESWSVVWFPEKIDKHAYVNATVKRRHAEWRTRNGSNEWLLGKHCWGKGNCWVEKTEKTDLRTGKVLMEEGLLGEEEVFKYFCGDEWDWNIEQMFYLKNGRSCNRQPLFWIIYLLFMTLILIIFSYLEP